MIKEVLAWFFDHDEKRYMRTHLRLVLLGLILGVALMALTALAQLAL